MVASPFNPARVGPGYAGPISPFDMGGGPSTPDPQGSGASGRPGQGLFLSTPQRTGPVNKTALLFAGLRDALASAQGQQSNYFDDQQAKDLFLQDRARQELARKALSAGLSTPGGITPANIGAAVAAGMDPAVAIQLLNAVTKQQPHYSMTPQFTKDGKGYVLGEDGSIQWLDPKVTRTGNPNQPFNADGSPNRAYQDYELRMKATGVPRQQKQDASNPFMNPGQY